jgi:hypothetical protein
MSFVFCIAGMVGETQLALADSECNASNTTDGRPYFKRAQAAEQAGRFKEAFKEANTLQVENCLSGYDNTEVRALLSRVLNKQGALSEKQGRLDEAFDNYIRSYQYEEQDKIKYADADRVKMKQVNASPRDRKVVSGAIAYFRGRNDRTGQDGARVTELHQLAAKNADLEFTNEAKAFAARKESFTELESAKDWLVLIGDAEVKKMRERAEQRGDTLAKEDTLRYLENAKHYFSIAEAKKKEQMVKDKALRLAQAHEKNGEITQATGFYSLAGDSAKGNELQSRSDAQHKKSEEKRQKQFNKGQDDLEKQLGM